MAAPDSLISLLRTVIQDDPDSPRYTDATLSRAIVSAALFIRAEIKLEQSYLINITAETISPDPTITPTVEDPDDNYTMLIIYKSACIIATGEQKKGAKTGGVMISDGPDKIDTTKQSQALKEAADTYCKMYSDAKLQYAAGILPGHAVMGAFRLGYFNQLPYGWGSPKRWW